MYRTALPLVGQLVGLEVVVFVLSLGGTLPSLLDGALLFSINLLAGRFSASSDPQGRPRR